MNKSIKKGTIVTLVRDEFRWSGAPKVGAIGIVKYVGRNSATVRFRQFDETYEVSLSAVSPVGAVGAAREEVSASLRELYDALPADTDAVNKELVKLIDVLLAEVASLEASLEEVRETAAAYRAAARKTIDAYSR